VLGLPLTVLALILTAGRILDMVTDSTVSYLSDNILTRFGRRRPWVIVGTLLFIPTLWITLVPGPGFNTTTYAVGLFLCLTALTSANIPLQAQSTELSRNYADRTRINVWLNGVNAAAVLSSYVIPYLLNNKRVYELRLGLGERLAGTHLPHLAWLADLMRSPPAAGVESYGSQMLVTAVIVAMTAPICLLIYGLNIPDGTSRHKVPRSPALSALRNPIFVRFYVGYLILITGFFGRFGLLPFILVYLFQSADFLLPMFTIMFGTSFLAVPIWSYFFRRFERRTIMFMAAMMEAAALLILALGPRGAGHEWLLILTAIIMGFPGLMLVQTPYLIAGECAEYCKLKKGYDARALHMNTISLIMKFGNVAAGIQISIAGLMGFSPENGNSESSRHILESLGLWAPIVLVATGGFVILTHPLTRRKQTTIQRALARKSSLFSSPPAPVI
jgi:GPH family glycoside/pentoside/hexuronide:cation symporter